jgi:hypothetical protein
MYGSSASSDVRTMDRRKVIRALKFCVIGLVLSTIILFALGLYTLFAGLVGAVSGETFGIELDKDTPNGDWLITLNASPRNSAILDERLFVNLGILDLGGEYIAANSTSVYIGPGGQSPFSLVLTIPYEIVQQYNVTLEQGGPVKFELIFRITTLGDLVGFTQVMRIAGEPEI